MPVLPKCYEAAATVGKFTVARKRADGMFYIFDEDGGVNKEACFSTLARAEAYVPTMDHLAKFSDTLAGVRGRPSWVRR